MFTYLEKEIQFEQWGTPQSTSPEKGPFEKANFMCFAKLIFKAIFVGNDFFEDLYFSVLFVCHHLFFALGIGLS